MRYSAEEIWADAQGRLKGMLNTETFGLWIAPIRAVGLQEDFLILRIPNNFFEAWLTENYMGLIRDVVEKSATRPLLIKFDINDSADAQPVEIEPSPAQPGQTGAMPRPAKVNNGDLVFNPNNTFETFVVGDNNIHAHAAAMAVAQAPGKSYNPLFLYGGVGLGKTHLLHAIGQYVASHKKNPRVAYVSSEKFTNEYIDALQNNSPARFRKKYRQQDVLLIDDIQFLAGKERIQEEFFHTFNALHDAHKQIVVTCDRPANELKGLEQRLISRFEWGLVADMQPPAVETRLAILRKKARLMDVELPDDILNFLANRIRSNVRRLEGALIRVVSLCTLTGRPLTVDYVEKVLSEILHEEGQKTITIEVIQKRVAEHYDIRLADMTSKRRPENIAFPRQIAMYLSRQLTDFSLSAVGEAFGGRDHGTVLHACRLIKDRMEIDTNVRQAVNHLERQLLR